MYPNFTYPLPDPAKADDAVRAAEEQIGEKNTALSYSAFRLFHETGSRLEYETEYMLHRKRLCAFAAAVLSGKDNERFLPALCDCIWAICDEYTWALPAHLPENESPKKTVERIDLFAAETAMALAEACAALGALLPRAVRERVLFELDRRTYTPYEQNRPAFGHNNWSAVCACGVGCSYLALGQYERFEKVKESLLRNLGDFADSIPDDGCCLEGSLYWAYGFGFYTYFADALYEYSDGKINLFADPKIMRLARFGQNSFLHNNLCVPFSDAPHTLTFEPGLWEILRRRCPDIVLPDARYASRFGDDVRWRFAPFIRNLYAEAVPSGSGEQKHEVIVYDKAGWMIQKNLFGTGRAFAAKAGHNDEPHNHNDIGSFVYTDGERFILDDLGWESYTKGYFDPERRYGDEFLCASSRSHSVPILNGKAQLAGRKHGGRILCADKERFSIEFSSAYEEGTVQRLCRTWSITENGLAVRDEADRAVSLAERFVTRIKPHTEGNSVIIDAYRLYTETPCTISVEAHSFTPRFAGNGAENITETAYFIDFVPEPCSDITFVLEKIEKEKAL